MKSRKKYPILIFLFIGFLSNRLATAQVSINLSSQALWGPVGYSYVEYYYLPEAEVYYYVPTSQFVYLKGNRWLMVYSLPTIYHINLYSTYKVVINQPRPYLQHNVYKVKYAKYKKGYKQAVIRDSKDSKYFVVKGHPSHSKVKVKSTDKTKTTVKESKPVKSGKKAVVEKQNKSTTSPGNKQSGKPSGGKQGGKPAGNTSHGSKKKGH